MVVESPNGVGESQVVAPGDGYSDAKKKGGSFWKRFLMYKNGTF